MDLAAHVLFYVIDHLMHVAIQQKPVVAGSGIGVDGAALFDLIQNFVL